MRQRKKSNKIILTENNIINKYLKKLNFKNNLVFDFKNDAAILKVPKNKELVISQDTITENIHFFKNDPPVSIACKALMVNLSDLYSMGSQPYAYSMSLTINNSIDSIWLKYFSNYLYKVQKKIKFYLLGGDIVKGKNLSISITIFGLINKKKYITRKGANINDDIWLSGTIGDPYIGYKYLKNKLNFNNKLLKKYYINSYYYPKPPHYHYIKLIKYINCAIDISDGLYGDLEKISVDFFKGAEIFTNVIPFSKNTIELINTKKIKFSELLTGGDDYQLLFTSNKENRHKIKKISKVFNYQLTRIGIINNSKKVVFSGNNLKIQKKSYIHKI